MAFYEDAEAISTWMERGVFAVTLLVALYLGATGPWQVGGPAAGGGCPVTGDASTLPLSGDRSADDLGTVEVYVSTYPAHADGRRCEHHSLDPGDRVTVEGVPIAVADDGAVLVDGNELADSQGWSRRTRYTAAMDPWYTRDRVVRFYNAGTVEVESGDDVPDRRVRLVTGTGSDRTSLNLVVAATFFSSLLVAIGIGLEWSVRFANVDLYRE